MQHPNNARLEIKPAASISQNKRIVLCSCRKDLRFAQRLLVHLASCPHSAGLSVWDDSHLLPGSLWQSELTTVLASAHFTILLISADFLASSFFSSIQLPTLLAAASSGGARILPVILHPCLFEESPLAPFYPINPPSRPLSLLPLTAREQLWVSLVRTILQSPSSDPTI